MKSKAYTAFISPNGSDKSEDNSVHQSSPAWVLTFVRWNVRDTLRAIPSTGNSEELLAVRDPLVVENDCVQLAVNVNKGNLTHSVNMTLVETDVNYSTAIHPGDFVLVNILNWEKDARRIVDIARSKKIKPINGVKDGFKGIFKIQGVRKQIFVDPMSGVKRVFYKINGFAFTEFNNSIYYNPYLRTESQGTGKDDLLFMTNLQADYRQLISPKNNPYCQDIIKFLIESFIGSGISDKGQVSAAGSPITANTHFYIPKQIGTFLGVGKEVKAAKDVYNYLFGIQQYAGSGNKSYASGLNPSNLAEPSGRFYYTKQKCNGQTILKAEYWNQQKAWSIINQYTNSPLNELYTCFRVDTSGRVMPTVVFRQIPFSSDKPIGFSEDGLRSVNVATTKFLNLPRWKIHPGLILSVDIGLDEAARINFVQYYASPPAGIEKADAYMSVQTAAGNYVYDINDVTRSGLRPYVVTTSFQDLTIDKDKYESKKWASILGDCVIGGHLKLNGTIECAGIVQPIAVGDNLEYGGTVYHIEEVNHVCTIAPANGVKTFRTVLKLSNGVSVLTDKNNVVYSEMLHTNAYQDRRDNHNNGNQILPGVSEEQDTTYRPNHPWPSESEINRKDRPFAQPGQVIKPLKDDDSE